MADPGTKAIVAGGVDDSDLCAHFFNAVNEVAAQSGVNVLSGKRCEQPRGVDKKIGVGKFDSGIFFARHGMAGKISVSRVSSKRFRGALDDLCLGAADVGYESLGRKRGTKPLNQVENWNYRSRKHDQIAAAHGICRIGASGIDGAALLRALQYGSTIASDDSPGKPAFF